MNPLITFNLLNHNKAYKTRNKSYIVNIVHISSLRGDGMPEYRKRPNLRKDTSPSTLRSSYELLNRQLYIIRKLIKRETKKLYSE